MRYTLEQIHTGINRHAMRIVPQKRLSRGQKGVIINILNEICNSDATRHLVLMWCFPYKWTSEELVSSKDLDESEWYALFAWIEPRRVMKGYWRGREELKEEIGEIFLFQMKRYKQIEMEEVVNE